MQHPRSLPPELDPSGFRAGDAEAAGVARSRLRVDDLTHRHRGVYARTAGDDFTQRCRELAPTFDGRRVYSHLTAARLWGMPLPFEWTPEEPLHTIAYHGAPPIRRPGVIGWETDLELKHTIHRDVPITQPAEVWAQLAMPGATGIDENGRRRSLSSDWLVAVGDFLLTGPKVDGIRVPLCTKEHLIAALARHKGKRGVRRAREAVERMRAPVHSPKETLLRLVLVDHGLPEPVVQCPVMTAAGLRHGDLGYPDERMLFEYQGDQHRTDRREWLEDLTRTHLFQDAGYEIVYVGANDIAPENAADFADRVRRQLYRRRTANETSRSSSFWPEK